MNTINPESENHTLVEHDDGSSAPEKTGPAGKSKILYYSAPLPPANELARYDAILPGAANRIITMVEKQSCHRQEMENKALNLTFVGQIITAIMGVSLIYLGYRLCISNNPWTGAFLGLLGASPLVVSASSYISKKLENEPKTEQ